jgi:hypothetical protein
MTLQKFMRWNFGGWVANSGSQTLPGCIVPFLSQYSRGFRRS